MSQNIPEKEDENFIRNYLDDGYKLFYHGLKAARAYNFSVGDVLIKNLVETDYDDETKRTLVPICVSHNNPTPKKYKVVAIDEFGIPWIRQISSTNGELGSALETLASFNLDAYHFTPDRAQAESILLGDEAGYNPIEAAKARRKEVVAQRKRNGKKILQSSLSSFWAEKFQSLKRSQEVWFRKDQRYLGSSGTYFRDKDTLENSKIRVLSIMKFSTIKEIKENPSVFDAHDMRENAIDMIKSKQEVVAMKYLSKDYYGKWLPAKEAQYVTNVPADYYGKLEDFGMYIEEPEVDQTK